MTTIELSASAAITILGLVLVVRAAVQLLSTNSSSNIRFLQQLDRRDAAENYHAMLDQPMRTRALSWIRAQLSSHRQKQSAFLGGYGRAVQRQLMLAGLDRTVIPEMIFVAQITAAVGGLAIGYAARTYVFGSGLRGWLIMVLLTGIASYIPRWRLNQAARRRSRRIARELPDVVELASMGIKAGLSIDAAFDTVVGDIPGPMSDEIRLLLEDITFGTPRLAALRAAEQRTDVRVLAQLMTTLAQAHESGMPVAAILQTSANEARLRRHQEAKEAAAKLPVKMLLPLVFCIFPPVLVITVGPAMTSIRAALS